MMRKAAEAHTEEALLRPTATVSALITIRERYLVPFALMALFGWAMFHGFETVQRIVQFYNPLPYWDYWRIPQHLSEYQALDLRVFWMQHNEHRIIFPEIVFALDMLFLHGREILPLVLSFLAYVATWLLLASPLIADRAVSLPVKIAATLLAGVIALWEGSAGSLAAPFQLQWPLLQLAVTCSLLCLARLKESPKDIYLAGVIAAAVVANYSSANGLLLWPLLIALAVALRLRRRQLAVLALAALTFGGLYFVGYQFGNNLNLRSLVTHPVYLLGYLTTYLSMPFASMKSVPDWGVHVGSANLFITALLLFVCARRRLLSARPAVLLFGSYAFTLATILITAAGRMDPNEVTFGAAKPPRYITVPLMNWAVFVLLCLWASARVRSKIVSPALLACVMSALLLFSLPKLNDWLAAVSEDFSQQQISALSVQNDLLDPNLMRKIFISVEFIVNTLPELREEHLSIYYKGRDRWLGKPVAQFSGIVDRAIPGQITSTFPLRSGVEVVGWTDLSRLRRPYTWIVLTNERDVIVGFGRRVAAAPFNLLAFDRTPPSLAWVAFANLTTPSRFLSAYVVDGRGAGLYKITGSVPVPEVQPASLEEAGAPIPDLTWQKDPNWSQQLPALVTFGQLPPGVSYASWSNNDAYTGQMISSTFLAPPNGCVVLPVLHGPRTGGLSVELSNADTGQSVATAPMQDGDTRWEYWRTPVPASIQHLRVTARDAGKDWGEWIAAGNPLTCR